MKLFKFTFENPYKTWWKARKYFKRPRIRLHFFCHGFDDEKHWHYNYPYAFGVEMAKILDIGMLDVMWKDKWHSPRHEQNPLIWLTLFGKVGFFITFHITYKDEIGLTADGDDSYWEYLLDYLYYDKDLRKSLSCHWRDSILWQRVVKYGSKEDGTEDVREPFPYVIPIHLYSLNKRGLKELREIIQNNKKDENS